MVCLLKGSALRPSGNAGEAFLRDRMKRKLAPRARSRVAGAIDRLHRGTGSGTDADTTVSGCATGGGAAGARDRAVSMPVHVHHPAANPTGPPRNIEKRLLQRRLSTASKESKQQAPSKRGSKESIRAVSQQPELHAFGGLAPPSGETLSMFFGSILPQIRSLGSPW